MHLGAKQPAATVVVAYLLVNVPEEGIMGHGEG